MLRFSVFGADMLRFIDDDQARAPRHHRPRAAGP